MIFRILGDPQDDPFYLIVVRCIVGLKVVSLPLGSLLVCGPKTKVIKHHPQGFIVMVTNLFDCDFGEHQGNPDEPFLLGIWG